MATLALCFWTGAIAQTIQAARLEPYDLRVEYLIEPAGLDVERPRFSWKLRATPDSLRGTGQSSWQILVATRTDLLAEGLADRWDSGPVADSNSLHQEYGGLALESGTAYHWTLRVWDDAGTASSWTTPQQWTTGLFHPADWQASWIGSNATTVFTNNPPNISTPDPWFRKTFSLAELPTRATAYVGSFGFHELYCNGQKAGDAVLTPNATDLDHRARYLTYDLSGLLQTGENVLGVWLGTAWSIFPNFTTTADKPLVIAQLELEFAGGGVQTIGSDGTWIWADSPNTLRGQWFFQKYGGERWEVAREAPGWCEVGFDDATWQSAVVHSPAVQLTADRSEPNRILQELRPVSITPLESGVYQADLGRVFTGWIEAHLQGAPGAHVDITFSENPASRKTFDLRSELILGPDGRGTFRNRFNYCTARWIYFNNLGVAPQLEDITGYFISTAFATAASFSCSDPVLQDIHDVTMWTFDNLSLGGYVVDCPHRERMGYGGDAHATTEAALTHYDMGAFYSKWAQDFRDVQRADGWIAHTAPTYWGGGGPSWSGFCITLPWEVYLAYGDRRILEENYGMMRDWMTFMESNLVGQILQRFIITAPGDWDFLGDWLWPGAVGTNSHLEESKFFNNCYMIYSLDCLARIAGLLGETEDAARYTSLAAAMRTAVHAAYYLSAEQTYYAATESRYFTTEQAYLAMALLANLPPEEDRPAVWQRLRENIFLVKHGHIDTGITGTWALLKLLIENGRSDWIYEMAGKTDYPSWGDMIRRGATTIWENWEGGKSLTHSSYLYIGTWFIEGVAGLRQDAAAPGYSHFVVDPGVFGSLVSASASYAALRGWMECDWRLDNGRFLLALEVPPGSGATIRLPCRVPAGIIESGGPLGGSPGISLTGIDGDRAILEAGPGRYFLESPFWHDAVPAPSRLRARTAGIESLQVDWTAASEAPDYYRLEYSPDGLGEWEHLANLPPTATSWVDSQLPFGTTRYYRLASVQSTILSPWSNLAGARTEAVYERYFVETGGQCIVEAEHYHTNNTNGDQLEWLTDTASAGYSGTGYMKTLDRGSTSPVWASAAELVYNVKIQTAGTYYLAFRRIAPKTASDALFCGVDNVQIGGNQLGITSTEWDWVGAINLGNLTAGSHTLHVRRREDGLLIDRLMIANSTASLPTDGSVGPAESAIVIITPTEPPEPATGLVVQPAPSSPWAALDLTWTDQSAEESGFLIYRSMDGTQFEWIASVPPATTTFADRGLSSQTRYFYRVLSYNLAGNAAQDATGDGWTAAPDLTARPRLQLSNDAEGHYFRIECPTRVGFRYTLLANPESPGVNSPAWVPAGLPATEGDGSPAAFLIPPPSQGRMFYMVRMETP